MDYKDTIKEYRHHNLMTQEEMASRCGISPVTLSRIETGKCQASGLTRAKIDQAMSKPIVKE